MKKIIIAFMQVIALSMLMGMTAIARPYNPNEYTSIDVQSELLPKTVKSDSDFVTPKARGEFFSGANVVITNEGNGNISGVAIAYLDVPVEEVYITLYLDRWDPDADRWRQVTYCDAEFYAADYPDGLNRPSLNVTFKNQEKGYYYRLRGVFSAVLDGEFEGFSPVTDGVWID